LVYGIRILAGVTGSLAALAAAFGEEGVSQTPVLQVDAAKVAARVSPIHSGLMTEEINHSYDGGLYAELIQNRVFAEEEGGAGTPFNHWFVIKKPGATVGIGMDVSDPLSAAVPVSLRIDASGASEGSRMGVANDGFWGIPVQPATVYRASFYAKAEPGKDVDVTVSIEGLPPHAPFFPDQGAPEQATPVFASGKVHVSGPWRRYELNLATAADIKPTVRNTRFVLSTERPGVFWVTLVSLFPPTWHNRPNGNRIDLMQKLADLHPKFLRFPGGNYLEGDTIATRFDWKRTLGPLKDRAGHPGCWSYWSSDGMGLLEFLEWCEDLDMEPVLGLYAGMSFFSPVVEAGPALEPYVRDALDEIEYVTGDAATPWGARRARDGHPEPFKLTYVEVGNEDGGHGYNERFAQFYDAIRAKYPALRIISTSGKVRSRVPDVVDEHFYSNAKWYCDHVHRYDAYDRKGPRIFVGEWATTEGSPTPDFGAALGDAVWMTGMERNADLVIMQCYAPLLVNVNTAPKAWQWEPT
jgi:alpha-N-arabinofuranosidase